MMEKKRILAVLLLAASLFLFPSASFADCDASGRYVPGSWDTVSPGGMAATTPNDCATGWSIRNMISRTMCLVMVVMSSAMFSIYCSIIVAWERMFQAALILYIALYGMSLVLGLANAREAPVKFIKISLITMLAMNPDAFYFFLYQNFIGFLDGFSMILTSTPPPIDPYTQGGTAVYVPGTTVEERRGGIFDRIDLLFEAIVGTDNMLALLTIVTAILLVSYGTGFSLMFLVLPGIIAAFMAFLRIMITYITSIMSLIFLLMFAPIFLTFLLFRYTQDLFYQWFASIISYTLQPVVILTFLFVAGNAMSISRMIGGQRIHQDDKPEVVHDDEGRRVKQKADASICADPDFNTGLYSCDASCMCDPVNHDNDIITSKMIPAMQIQQRGEYSWNILGINVFLGKWPKFVNMTPMTIFVIMFQITAFITAWLLISSIVVSFLPRIPAMAQQIVRWRDIKAAAVLGGEGRMFDETPEEARKAGRSQMYSMTGMLGDLAYITSGLTRRAVGAYAQHYLKTAANPLSTKFGRFAASEVGRNVIAYGAAEAMRMFFEGGGISGLNERERLREEQAREASARAIALEAHNARLRNPDASRFKEAGVKDLGKFRSRVYLDEEGNKVERVFNLAKNAETGEITEELFREKRWGANGKVKSHATIKNGVTSEILYDADGKRAYSFQHYEDGQYAKVKYDNGNVVEQGYWQANSQADRQLSEEEFRQKHPDTINGAPVPHSDPATAKGKAKGALPVQRDSMAVRTLKSFLGIFGLGGKKT